ncbi:hypothetical protein JQ634_34860 [Bradyrhizobium sp. AUGA SZCCT0240]|jgi:hypothetical protein|uniref:hypothetical protein n=1 Tax=unclassified Bradyrhizobium TaxID=2631580 RepID=UPI001BA4C293|nr:MULTISPECIES: hypothetical protein [unclassified Bradyrhizobium]MBR1200983.1 hypothetical protein [Bradyrhizobium sp. AUGA SZCCT0158]MBR1245050.1 hypothetical protein [Bradyrhizobium sp. AUGA SZCCT0274]MBR1251220.1 hypothetical protein [Bradyrhizobium sp. AUGA SZCCT0169]MBR1258836.1 hypothetical protein [Bradyrhizobium sp. AUGA SZCCT0240]
MLSRTAYVSVITLAAAAASLATASVAQAGMIGNSNFAGSKTVINRPMPTPPRVQPTRPMINSNLKLHCHKYVDRTTNPGHPVMATTCH